MATRSLFSKPMAAVLASALLMGGCSLEGTQVNGKLFDLMGISSAAQEKARAEPKMTARSGLVMPPDQTRLPTPGSGEESVVALNDPEKIKAQNAAERERLHQQYCNGELSWKERIKDADAPFTSPYGSCNTLTTSYGRPQQKQ